ncbi:MAG: HEAT repeat domain-containing protein [Fimbriimonadales bacterium]|nr:HEAT repeat domain-containing protein [Fimbriimonadales bacterium]MDW8051695.1 HEAT repeat domain-containing protein [Armatimonadota bacterium]
MRYLLTLLLIWQAGVGVSQQAFRYKVSGESASRAWFGALQGAIGETTPSPRPPDLDLRQQYTYILTLTQLTPTQFEAQWSEWRLKSELTPELKQLLEQIRQLSPVYFRRNATGALEFLSTGQEAWQRQAIASILYPFQFVRSDSKATEWRVEEAHPSGRVVCRYRLVRRRKDGVQIFNKAVVEVLLSEQERQLGKSHQIHGYLQYAIDSQGVIRSVSGSLRERVQLRGLPASESYLKIDVRLERRLPIAADSLRAKQARLAQQKGTWFTLYAPPTETEQELARARAHLRGASQAQLLAELDAMLKQVDQSNPIPPEQQIALRLRLEAGLIVYGTPFLRELVQRLRQRPRDDDGFWLLAGVLSHSRMPEAHKALLDALDAATEPSIQRGLAQQLSFLSAPRPETVEALWKRAREMPTGELQQILVMSLTNLAWRIREQAPSLYQQISDWSRAQLEAAPDAPNQRFWLTAVGNLGDPKALSLIEQHARRGDELIRISAIDALQRYAPKDAIPILERLYPLEPSVAVREKMVQLLPQWWEDAAARALMERAALNDLSSRVRKACIRALGSLAPKHRDALQLLVKIAETDFDPAVRREAMITLAALHASGVEVPRVKAVP